MASIYYRPSLNRAACSKLANSFCVLTTLLTAGCELDSSTSPLSWIIQPLTLRCDFASHNFHKLAVARRARKGGRETKKARHRKWVSAVGA